MNEVISFIIDWMKKGGRQLEELYDEVRIRFAIRFSFPKFLIFVSLVCAVILGKHNFEKTENLEETSICMDLPTNLEVFFLL